MDKAVLDRPWSSRIRSGTIRGILGDLLASTVFQRPSTRDNTTSTRTNTDKPGSNTQSTDCPAQPRQNYGKPLTYTADTRITPDKHGSTRHLHGPCRTYRTTTRINTAAIRTKHDLPGPTLTCLNASSFSEVPSFCNRKSKM